MQETERHLDKLLDLEQIPSSYRPGMDGTTPYYTHLPTRFEGPGLSSPAVDGRWTRGRGLHGRGLHGLPRPILSHHHPQRLQPSQLNGGTGPVTK